MKLINIGFGNIVSGDRVIAIVSPDSAPIKRIVQESKDKGLLIDATCGRRTRAVIITERPCNSFGYTDRNYRRQSRAQGGVQGGRQRR